MMDALNHIWANKNPCLSSERHHALEEDPICSVLFLRLKTPDSSYKTDMLVFVEVFAHGKVLINET